MAGRMELSMAFSCHSHSHDAKIVAPKSYIAQRVGFGLGTERHEVYSSSSQA